MITFQPTISLSTSIVR